MGSTYWVTTIDGRMVEVLQVGGKPGETFIMLLRTDTLENRNSYFQNFLLNVFRQWSASKGMEVDWEEELKEAGRSRAKGRFLRN